MSGKDRSEINIIYNINKDENYIKIFGSKFVKNNKNICKMKINNKEYEIIEEYSTKNFNNIKLRGIENVADMSDIFRECSSLISLPDISKWDTNNVIDMNGIFNGCTSLSSLPGILKWNTNNVTNMSCMFSGCSSLSTLPDISNWNTNKVTDMNNMFNGCSSLSSLPDI